MASSINDFDRTHVQEILQDSKCNRYDWFSAMLLRLIAHGDKSNREQIRLAYPDHVKAYEDWFHQRDYYAQEAAMERRAEQFDADIEQRMYDAAEEAYYAEKEH